MEISVDERCRINHLATSIIALGQVLFTPVMLAPILFLELMIIYIYFFG